jgi:hypothetical protein
MAIGRWRRNKVLFLRIPETPRLARKIAAMRWKGGVASM